MTVTTLFLHRDSFEFDICNLERPWVAVGRSTRFAKRAVRFAKRRISREGTWKVWPWKIACASKMRDCHRARCRRNQSSSSSLSTIELRYPKSRKKFWNFEMAISWMKKKKREKKIGISIFAFVDRPRVIILVLVGKARHDFSESLAVS